MTSRFSRVLLAFSLALTLGTAACKPNAARPSAHPTLGNEPVRGAGASLTEPMPAACAACVSDLQDGATLLATTGECEIEIDFAGGEWKHVGGNCSVQPASQTLSCSESGAETSEVSVFSSCPCECEAAVRKAGKVKVVVKAEGEKLPLAEGE